MSVNSPLYVSNVTELPAMRFDMTSSRFSNYGAPGYCWPDEFDCTDSDVDAQRTLILLSRLGTCIYSDGIPVWQMPTAVAS